MTRLQELPWTERVAPKAQPSPLQQGKGLANRVNLYRIPWLRPLIESSWPQFLLRVVTLTGFIFTIVAGLAGPAVGSHNFAIIFVWIAWWTALKLVFIPLGGKSWCSVCPIPLPGDWLQQGGIIHPGKKTFGLRLRWPVKLRGSWMQSGGFLLIGLFSALTLTDPRLTGWILLGIFGLAIGLSLVFEKRAFCSHLCPIGAISGMYAQTSPVEVRVIDKEICIKHETKSCYQACPWGLYPVGFRDNTACGMCMECLRACPSDNLALNLRPFNTDLGRQKTTPHLDETFLALVMLGSVISFTAVFSGPWGWLKSAAFDIGSARWLGYAAGFLGLNLLVLPFLFGMMVWLGRKISGSSHSLKQSISNHSKALIPIGLMAWIAFTISFALPKLDFIINVINDPFGFGWRILGVFPAVGNLMPVEFSTLLQVSLLMIGLFWSARVTLKISGNDGNTGLRSSIPVLLFALAFIWLMLWLLVG